MRCGRPRVRRRQRVARTLSRPSPDSRNPCAHARGRPGNGADIAHKLCPGGQCRRASRYAAALSAPARGRSIVIAPNCNDPLPCARLDVSYLAVHFQEGQSKIQDDPVHISVTDAKARLADLSDGPKPATSHPTRTAKRRAPCCCPVRSMPDPKARGSCSSGPEFRRRRVASGPDAAEARTSCTGRAVCASDRGYDWNRQPRDLLTLPVIPRMLSGAPAAQSEVRAIYRVFSKRRQSANPGSPC